MAPRVVTGIPPASFHLTFIRSNVILVLGTKDLRRINRCFRRSIVVIRDNCKHSDRNQEMNDSGGRIHETLRSRRADVERVAESLGVAALAVDSAALTAAQLHMIARGLRDVQGELHDLSDTLRLLAGERESLGV